MLTDTGDRLIVVEGTKHFVRPPVVREAAEVLACLAEDTDSSMFYLHVEVMEKWLAPELYFRWDAMEQPERVKMLTHLLYDGMELRKVRKKAEPTATPHGEESGPTDWADLLALYCHAYGGDPWKVWTEVPFPFFMTMVGRADRYIARQLLSQIDLVCLPHMAGGSRQVIANMQSRAGYRPGVGYGTKEEIAKGRKALKAMFGVERAN